MLQAAVRRLQDLRQTAQGQALRVGAERALEVEHPLLDETSSDALDAEVMAPAQVLRSFANTNACRRLGYTYQSDSGFG